MIFFNSLLESEGIVKSKKCNSFNELFILVDFLRNTGESFDSIAQILKDDYEFTFVNHWLSKETCIKIALNFLNSGIHLKGDCDLTEIVLYKQEIEFLDDIKDSVVRKILFLLLVIAKWNNHPSKWIRFIQEDYFSFWNLNLVKKNQEDVIKKCCDNGLNLRVIGGKNPIVCFNLSFKEESGEEYYILLQGFTSNEVKQTYFSFWRE